MGLGFWIALALFGAFVWLVAKVMRRSANHAALEEREAWQRRQVEAVKAEAHTENERRGRMADAAAQSVSEPADDVRKRMRERDPGAR